MGAKMALQARLASLEVASGRGRQRRTLRLAVNASVAGEPARTTIHNISETGLLIETDIRLPVGEWIDVELPGAEPRPAQVVWISESLYGCKFDGVITSATLSASVLRSPFDAEPLLGTPKALPEGSCEGPEKLPIGWRVWIVLGATVSLWAIISAVFSAI